MTFGASAVAVPGLGALIAAGALVGAVGGAGIGAAAGGLIGLLVENGFSHEEAQYYHERVHLGAALVTVRDTARETVAGAKRASRQARKVPGVAQVEGQIKGAVASEEDLPIPGYDDLNADEIVAKLSELSQIDLAKIDSYERKYEGRTTVLSRIDSLRGNEPWPGYDELTAAEVVSALSDGDDERVARQVRDYERAHKGRATVLRAAERELATA